MRGCSLIYLKSAMPSPSEAPSGCSPLGLRVEHLFCLLSHGLQLGQEAINWLAVTDVGLENDPELAPWVITCTIKVLPEFSMLQIY